MPHLNVEIKAACSDPDRIRSVLRRHNADFRGTDHQTDTYFKIPAGRLKLREGNIENALIFYNRPNQPGPKTAHVSLCPLHPDSKLKDLLTNALGILTTVRKQREIYFIQNVKFHIDSVDGLGSFVEIESIGSDSAIGTEKLLDQCKKYLELFAIADEDLIDCSYSDMLLRTDSKPSD